MDVSFNEGATVGFRGENWRVCRAATLEWVELESMSGAKRLLAPIGEVGPPLATLSNTAQQPLPFGEGRQEQDALRLLECIRPLLNRTDRTKEEVRNRAREFGISIPTAYRLMARWEQLGRIEALFKRKSSGGRGKSRLEPRVEEVLQEAVPTYFTDQKPTMRDVINTVSYLCHSKGINPPSDETVRQRIRQIDEQIRVRKRQGRKAAARYESHPNSFDRPTYPLALVEIDHTVLNAMLVDGKDRHPIGRDVWITLALDVFSRMVIGYYISLDPVGEFSTGMCIAHAIMKKGKWLQEHEITTEWPCWGVMDCIHVDNALEFRGKMLRRACAQYGIEINFRPVGRPNFGGHIERFFGTLSKQLHKLPGTTFSNIIEKAEYDSEGKACLTFDELDTFVAKWITEVYHLQFHRGIGTTPLKKYKDGFIAPDGRRPPRIIGDTDGLQRSFMPAVERTIQPTGVEISYVRYFGPELEKWTGLREHNSRASRKFTFHRDPRDLSRVFFFDPDKLDYIPLYRTDNVKTSASIWEWDRGVRELKKEGRKDVDEPMILKKVIELRQLALTSKKKTMARRREIQRLTNHIKQRKSNSPVPRLAEVVRKEPLPPELIFSRPVRPFDDTPVTPVKDIQKL